MASALKALAQLILSNVERLESVCEKHGTDHPSLDTPFVPSALDADPVALEASRQIVGAAAQLLATVRQPMEVLQDYCSGMYTAAAVQFVNANDVVDILQQSGSQGLHSNDIGLKTGVDSSKIDRLLRYLATRHFFREVQPNVYANNKISSIILKLKSLAEIQKDPVSKYDGSPGAAMAGHFTEEAFMGSQHIAQFMKDPGQYQSPFNMAIQDTTNIFAWFEKPENVWRGRRFVAAMKGGGERFPPEIFSSAIDWKALKSGSSVVDVGGNVGSVTLPLAKAFPHLHFVVQDLDHVINEAQDYWKENCPEALTDGRVELQVHDFFKPMPVKADVYFLRVVLHDWPQAEGVKILQNIRDAAKPSSKLILFESIVPHACKETSPFLSDASAPTAPAPLLPNYGLGLGGFVTMVDIQMMTLLGGRERTIEEFVELGKESGWKLEEVKPGPLATFIYSPV
ncbi:hypothetical protein HGRIS_006926 [Hohenbuehelia grisea]|uniref:S-adenosyl-L-methionine-dependent methyltransferase n=1 Tax=Hohenbuehelia grisea TaxID=104357 RepID=A0ABR3JAU8_9AGAR